MQREWQEGHRCQWLRTSYACAWLQERRSLLVSPGTEVYEGMIVGENFRGDDMDVNITRVLSKESTRTSSSSAGLGQPVGR